MAHSTFTFNDEKQVTTTYKKCTKIFYFHFSLKQYLYAGIRTWSGEILGQWHSIYDLHTNGTAHQDN